MGLPFGSSLEHVKELSASLSNSFAASGNPMKDLARILSGKKLKLSVQNQSLQIRKNTEALQKEAIVLRDETGLIASPEIGSNGEITVKCLLMAELMPGRKVFIDSVVFNGFATIETVRLIGANFGAEWGTEAKCKVSNI